MVRFEVSLCGFGVEMGAVSFADFLQNDIAHSQEGRERGPDNTNQ